MGGFFTKLPSYSQMSTLSRGKTKKLTLRELMGFLLQYEASNTRLSENELLSVCFVRVGN